ncbi:MAG: hypothetical protein MJZ76_08205 [Bacteroidales bacterium]|nr:hypothetical protein [Bacteroidales bacterium]
MKTLFLIAILNLIPAPETSVTIPPAIFSTEGIEETQDNEIPCLEGTYTTTYKGKTVTIEIVDARYNNFFSYKGSLSGFIKYNGKTYPAKGHLELRAKTKDYSISFCMTEYDQARKISFDFYGVISCSRTYQEGWTMLTPGLYSPDQHTVDLKRIK